MGIFRILFGKRSKPEDAADSKNDEPVYDGLHGRAFLEAYFRDHGLTEDELLLIEKWDGYWGCEHVIADDDGLSYAAMRTEKMIEYRDKSAEDVLHNIDDTPWAWPSAMHFEKLWHSPPKSNQDVWTILHCVYNGKGYLFGVGKEEATITEDMRKNGEWRCYTFAD